MNAAYPLIKTNQRDKTMKQGLDLRHTPLCHHVQFFNVIWGVSKHLADFLTERVSAIYYFLSFHELS